MKNNDHKKISKFLSLILRHKPETIGITLTDDGWTDTTILLEKMNAFGKEVDLEILKAVVDNNNKKRFAFADNFSRIRANQGHSLEVNLGYEEQTPPDKLYHGTAEKFLQSILNTGIEKRNRHHVHLSKDIATATDVGSRHGKPVILHILAKEMHAAGFKFYESENKVWLTEHVPVKYILQK